MKYDLIIIGAGWAGYSAAVRARDLGLTVALIEKDLLGGTCLNSGCIPTKSLVQSCATLHSARIASRYSPPVSLSPISLETIIQKKQKVVETLRANINSVLKQKQIPLIQGEARFIDDHRVRVGEDLVIEAAAFLIATGSEPIALQALPFDRKKVLNSTQILDVTEIPRRLLIVGGGVIGCEFAHIFNSLGSAVTISELTGQLVAPVEIEAAKKITTIFKKRSIEVLLKTDASTLPLDSFDKILVCIGRRPRFDPACFGKAGIVLERGRMSVNQYLQTNIPHIFSAGDCSSDYQLAHVAAHEGRHAAMNIYRMLHSVKSLVAPDYRAVPNCIFTEPQIATVGLSEDHARRQNIAVTTTMFHFLASGMAHILEQTQGFLKLTVDSKHETIVGGVIVGPHAAELINTIALAINCRIKARDIASTIFAHPSLSESITESLQSYDSPGNN